jgi:membrane associated rhomboid family serine protease
MIPVVLGLLGAVYYAVLNSYVLRFGKKRIALQFVSVIVIVSFTCLVCFWSGLAYSK